MKGIATIAAKAKAAASKGNQARVGGWKGLPGWVKGIIIVGGAVVVYKVGKKLLTETRLNADIRDSIQEEQGWNQEYQEEQAGPVKATLSKTSMKQVANKLHNAMDGYGTRDYDIKTTFKGRIKNNADFAGVQAAYGVRTLQPGHGVGWMVPSYKGTLTQCLENDASSSTIDYINKLMKARNIKYRI